MKCVRGMYWKACGCIFRNCNGNTLGGRIFDVFNYIILTLVAFTTIAPFIYIIGASFATEYELAQRPLLIIPHEISFNAYEYIFSTNKIVSGFKNSIFITAAGTVINLFFTVTMAYAISKTRLRGRNFFLNMVIFSMFFGGGMIPSYIVTANMLNLKDTYWAVLLPGAISAYNMMIVKNFFQGIPQELEESASLDGCTDVGILWRILLPLSLSVLATFGLFYAVGHWNSYFNAMMYLNDNKLYPLQLVLRDILLKGETDLEAAMGSGDASLIAQAQEAAQLALTMKYSLVFIASAPMLVAYPFVQKHFVKGMMVGSVKG